MDCPIQVRGLSLSYRWKNYEKSIFQDLNLCFPRGSFVTIQGGNGSGKSSLLKLILGLIYPQSGDVLIEGLPVNFGYPQAVREHTIAYLAQRIDQFFYADTVLEELSYNQIELNDENTKYLHELGLDHLLERAMQNLSGGEKQGLALAQFMMSPASILILDEPSSYLDEERASILRQFLDEAHTKGKTIIYVTQYPLERDWGTHSLDLDSSNSEIVAL